MRPSRSALLFLPLALASYAAGAVDFRWEGAIPADGVLSILLVRGDIAVEPAADGRVEVTGRKRGDFVVRGLESDGNVTICAVHTGKDRCPGGKSERDADKGDDRIDMTVRLPAGVRLVADTHVGAVRASGLASPIVARTVVGDIELATSRHASAESVNGNIRASLGSTSWQGTLAFETVNGDVVVRLPAEAHLDLAASTTTGRFESDLFPVEEKRYGPSIPGANVTGTLGRGGRALRIGTVNGNVTVEAIR